MTDISFYADQVRHAAWEFTNLATRPSVLYQPKLFPDGTKWCALLGDDLMTGVAGFGDTPHAAMSDFDAQWFNSLTPRAAFAKRESETPERIHPDSQFGVGA